MSKLTKLINEPEKFLEDALLKRKREIDLVNKAFTLVGLDKTWTVQNVETKFIHSGLKVYDKYHLRYHLISLMHIQSSLKTKDLRVLKACLIARYGGDARLSREVNGYITPKLLSILKSLKVDH